jgi:hypothetical protein
MALCIRITLVLFQVNADHFGYFILKLAKNYFPCLFLSFMLALNL